VIKTFADKRTAALFSGQFVKGLPADVAVRAKNKLDLIDSAASLDFLRVPPGKSPGGAEGRQEGATQHSGERAMARVLSLVRGARPGCRIL
jgi:toxin HigB-1